MSGKSSKRWKRRDIIFLLERLELYISSGLTINQSLEICAKNSKAKQKRALDTVAEEIHSGRQLFKSLEKGIGISSITSGLIECGESAGNLSQALGRAKEILERQDELIKKCTSAMIYPLVIGAFALVLTFGLVRGVMPQIIPMLQGLHVKLPLLTVIVITISNFTIAYGTYLLIAGIVLIIGLPIIYRKSLSVRRLFQGLLIHIPLIGSFIRKYSISVFLQSVGALIESGVSVAEASLKSGQTVWLVGLRSKLIGQIDQLKNGELLSQLFKANVFPDYVISLTEAGEASGSLGKTVVRSAQIMDTDIEQNLKRLTGLIEPIMMIFMGLAVGSIALSIMMPIYDISKVLQK